MTKTSKSQVNSSTQNSIPQIPIQPQVPIIETLPTQLTSKEKIKWLIIGGLVVGVMFLIGGVFSLKYSASRRVYLNESNIVEKQDDLELSKTNNLINQEDELLSGWEVYTNKKNKFSFKYPDSLIHSDCIQGLHLFQRSSGKKSSTYCESSPFGAISIDFAVGSFPTGYSDSTAFQVVSEIITIAGITAEKQTIEKIGEVPGPNYLVTISFIYDSKNYLITLRDKNYVSEFNQIISTFEFIKDTEINDVSDWELFTTKRVVDFQNPFTIHYPSSWSIDFTYYDASPGGMSLTLSKGDSTILINQGPMGGGYCLYPEDLETDGMVSRYGKYKLISKSDDVKWRSAERLDPLNIIFVVCELKDNVYLGLTDIGSIEMKMEKHDQLLIEEFNEILQRIEILD